MDVCSVVIWVNERMTSLGALISNSPLVMDVPLIHTFPLNAPLL